MRTMARTEGAAPGGAEFASVALQNLTIDSSFREGGLRQEHVDRLVALRGHWPPILVGAANGLVIDGMHRVAAARVLGLDRLAASFFEGGPDDALIEFVRRNVNHGLPLTLRERKRAASRVLLAHGEWSDRRIADLCAISPKTVARLRRGSGDGPVAGVTHLDRRIGRDNKLRPVNSRLVRTLVADAIREQPDASLRTIAASVGVSPETVRSVRGSMDRTPSVASDDASCSQSLSQAPCDDGEDFIAWFDRTSVDEEESRRLMDAIPRARVREIVAEAHRRSEVWQGFARRLEQRTRKRKKASASG